MALTRVCEVAKQLGITNKALLEILYSLDISAKNHMSVLDDSKIARLSKALRRDSGKRNVVEVTRVNSTVVRRRQKIIVQGNAALDNVQQQTDREDTESNSTEAIVFICPGNARQENSSTTKPYSTHKNNTSNSTLTYQDDPSKTKTYEEKIQLADQTVGYKSEETELTDKTIAHNLGIGDKIELNGKEYKITGIISGEQQSLEAVIYKITHGSGKDYALKLYYKLTNPKDEPNPEALARIKAINDPDILKLHDFGTGHSKYQNKFCFEVCDLAEGSNLISVPDIRKKYTIDFLESNVIPEIFKGIRALHDYKIYHCDLKPENIYYLDKEQTDLIIGDYGSAKTFEQTSEKQLTHTSTTKGTSFYLAPEQPRGIVSEKNDYYSFGMILVHLLYSELVNRDSLHKIIERQFAKKPIIDFNPEYRRINDLIAGLTLYDISSRWGEDEVKAWLRGEDVEVKYTTQADVRVQPINLGETVIRTVDDLIAYIENHTDWHVNLVEDQEGYGLLLRWVSDLQGLDQKKVFDKMVRTYQQDGEGFLKQAVLRYFMPEMPIQIDMKTYDFWKTRDIGELTISFFKHLDDIWKITSIEELKSYLFQFEFSLRQIEAEVDGKQKVLVRGILDKISSALFLSPKGDFEDYICTFYVDLSDDKLINLFYAFDNNRTFKDLENKSYNTIEDVGLLFAKDKKIFDNKYIRIEKKFFLKSNDLSNFIQLSYDNFLYTTFNDSIRAHILISDILFETPRDKRMLVNYKFGQSLEDFFNQKSIKNNLTHFDKKESIVLDQYSIRSPKKSFCSFIEKIEKKHKINKSSIGNKTINKTQDDFISFFKTFKKNNFKNGFIFSLGTIFFLLPLFVLLYSKIDFGNTYDLSRGCSFSELFGDIYKVHFLILISFIPAIIFSFSKNPIKKLNLKEHDNINILLSWLVIFLIAAPIIIFIALIPVYLISAIPIGILSILNDWTFDNAMNNFIYFCSVFLYLIPGIVLIIWPIIKFFVELFEKENLYVKKINVAFSSVFITVPICFLLYFNGLPTFNTAPQNNIKPPQLVDVSLKLNSGTGKEPGTTKHIQIHRAGFYLFNHIKGYSPSTYPLRIDFGDFSITTDKLPVFDKHIFIEKPGRMTFRYNSRYVRDLTTKFQIKEIQKKPKEFGVILHPNRYSNFVIPFKKGMKYKIKNPNEIIYVDIFNKNERIDSVKLPQKHQELGVHPKEYIFKYNSDKGIQYCWNRYDTIFYCYSKYDFKLKSAEVPYLLMLEGQPYFERLKINGQDSGLATYMEKGESIKTQVWLDKGDTVKVWKGYFNLATENERWTSEKNYRCTKDGFLRVRALNKARLNNIKVTRNKKWKFTLKSNQSHRKIRVYTGDIMTIYSTTRYYLNGEMQDKGKSKRSFSNERVLDFKGSVQPAKIEVGVIKRKGF